MPRSRGSINAEPATITSESDTEQPVGWTSSDHGDRRITGDVPYQAFTRHHEETLRYGNAIQSRRERGYGQPVPVTQRGSIPTDNDAHSAGS